MLLFRAGTILGRLTVYFILDMLISQRPLRVSSVQQGDLAACPLGPHLAEEGVASLGLCAWIEGGFQKCDENWPAREPTSWPGNPRRDPRRPQELPPGPGKLAGAWDRQEVCREQPAVAAMSLKRLLQAGGPAAALKTTKAKQAGARKGSPFLCWALPAVPTLP